MAKNNVYDGEGIIQKLKRDLPNNYQIGLHQIGVFGTPESKKIARQNNFFSRFRPLNQEDFCRSIMKTGLRNRYEDLMFTVAGFGSVDEIENSLERKEEFLTYDYNKMDISLDYVPKEHDYDIIVAIPSHVNINKKEYFIGYLEHGTDEKHKIRNEESSKLFEFKPIPKEFIYGYIHKEKNKKYALVQNKYHVSKMKIDKQEEFYKSFIEKRDVDLSKIEVTDNINRTFGEQLNDLTNEASEVDLVAKSQKNIEEPNIERQ